VVPRQGGSLSLPELVAFLQTHEIARFKLPERLELLPDFPVSTFGKVSKKALGEQIAAQLEAEAQAKAVAAPAA
jgi:2,3-dihydroxybenzoate-AMP ligase